MTAHPRPVVGQSRPYEFPATEQFTAPNGIRVIVAPLSAAPVTSILASVGAGADIEEREIAGLGYLTGMALLEGTTELTADALAARCEALGAEAEAHTDWVHSTVELTIPGERHREALRLVQEILEQPQLPDDGISRLRDERLAEIEQDRSDPRNIADEEFLAAVFASRSRYSVSHAGGSPQVSGLRSDSVRLHHRSFWKPTNTLLVVAGSVDPGEVARAVSEVFGGWTGSHEERPAPEPTAESQRRRVLMSRRPGAPQSELRVGHVSVARNHPAFHEVTVMNAVLGGLFTSRINLNLRERNAFTYYAYSGFDWRRRGSAFAVSTAVRSDATNAALTEIVREVERIREEHITDAELSLARNYLAGVFPIRFETTEAIANAIAMRERFGMPPAHYSEYRQRISAIDADAVLHAARAYLHPDHLQIAVVGDPPGGLDSLASFGEPIELAPA